MPGRLLNDNWLCDTEKFIIKHVIFSVLYTNEEDFLFFKIFFISVTFNGIKLFPSWWIKKSIEDLFALWGVNK